MRIEISVHQKVYFFSLEKRCQRTHTQCCHDRRATILFVVTGGPSVGKTTIITLLQERGFRVVPEQATQIIKEGEYLPWVDRDRFQREVLRRQMEVEAPYVDSDDIVFLDRAVYDGEAYYINDGMVPPADFEDVNPRRYARAFLVEELSTFDNNGVRWENQEFTRKITPIFEDCYAKREIPVTRIPAMSPIMRLGLVIDTVAKSYKMPVVEPTIVMPPLVYA